ncbi:MAG: hypothetical protein LAT75_05085 [Candidatus Cyclonatronum sp.]|uniref:hypothetical protein n=1 Tax=Cyclonatronum sp. TaxID=3024185 RepID=UPI0025C22327|nr:hypothetical protein [Cyclonatronum sp.]MCC5934922.1 hypothetical protein [Balneolales bacterium]MCH8486217.1 hypothetical protein [Cyclonatronum sp.]
MKFENPDPFQQTIARTFTYTTTAFLIGATFYLFTSNLISLTLRPDWIGTAMLLLYGLAYGNITYFITRRYLRREFTFNIFSYLIGLIVLFPTVLLVKMKGNVFPAWQNELFFFTVITGGMLIGIWKGRIKGAQMFQELKAKRAADS